MTVKELIDKLKELNYDMEVMVSINDVKEMAEYQTQIETVAIEEVDGEPKVFIFGEDVCE